MSGEGTWACHVCTLENPSNKRHCHACQSRRQRLVEEPPSSSAPTSVRSWIQRRRKRKRSPQPTVSVQIKLNGEQWEPLHAHLSRRTRHQDIIAVPNEPESSQCTGDEMVSSALPQQQTVSEGTGNSERTFEDTSPQKQQQGESSGGWKNSEKQNEEISQNVMDASSPALSGTASASGLQREEVDPECIEQHRPASEPSSQRPLEARDSNETMISNAANFQRNMGSRSEARQNVNSGDFESATDAVQKDVATKQDHRLCGKDAPDHGFASKLVDDVSQNEEIQKSTSRLNDESENTLVSSPTQKNEPTSSALDASSIQATQAKIPFSATGLVDNMQTSDTSVLNPNSSTSPVDHDDDAKSSEKRQDSLVQNKPEGECQEGMDDDTSSNQEPVDIGFSQLMTQDPGGFLYTQMSQGEADNSVALPLAETVEPLQAYSKPTATASILQEIEATTFECLLPETAGKDDIDDTLHEMKRADLSNKCSHVSSQQLSLTKVMHPPSLDEKTRKDENARIPVPPLGNVVLMTQNRGMSRLPPSFMSAGNGNVVSVTAESLARASALVHSTTAEKQATQTDSTVKSSSDSTMQPIIMFQTARKGIAISVSNDSPARAITDEKKDEKTLHANEPLPSAKMQNFSAIFQTAGKGMKISVTDDSLKMANTLFQESAADGMNVAKASPANTPEAEQSQSNSGDENIVKSNFSSLLANTTISRKNCREAEAAIQRQDRQPTSLQTHAPLSMASFQTAGTGSFISVSENSLAKAETLFHGSTATVGSEATMFSPKPPRPMFRTVRESLKHAVTSLQDMVEDSSGAGSERSSSQDRISDSHNPLPAMFQTAGRRSSITVSVEDMARANAILRDKSDRAQSAQKYQAKAIRTEATASSRFPPSAPLIQNADNGSLVPVSCSASVGDPSAPAGFVTPFQTAGKGHAISVSDASLEKANFVLEEKRVLDPHVEPTAVPKCGNHPRTSLSPALSQSQIAGTMSDRSMTGATALLEGMQTTKHVVFGQKPSPRKLASLSCCVSGFKTAGQDNAIAVSKESLTQASALVQGESLGMVEPPGVALSPAFRSAGKGEAIAVTGESLRNASNLFEERMSGEVDTEDHTVVVENKTRSFTGQASHAPVFQTAGKKSSIRVPEDVLDRATALLDKNWAQIGASAKKSVRETCEDHAIPLFRTAAMSSAISVSEKIVSKATAKLAETNDHAAVGEERNDLIPNGESETLKETSLSESNESCVTATMVRTAGKGSAIAVSAEFVARANDILQGMSTCDDKGGDKESLEGACSVMPTTSIPRAPAFMGSTPQSVALDSFETSSDLLPELAEAINEAGETSEDGTKNLRAPGKENLSCNTLDAVPDQLSSQKDACCNAQSSHASVAEISERRCYMLQDDHGLATQPLPPETPLLCSRHAQPEKYGQEDSLRIRTVAFGLTPQSQSIDRKEPRSGAARILPLNHSNDHERSTERITFPAVTPSNWVEREQRQEPPVSIRKLPAFTPKQESTESNTIVTMSFDPKNPYTRKLHDSSSNTFGEKGKLSPVPINFRHLEGSFRGEALSPSAIAYAQNVLAGERASLSNQVDQSQPTAGRPNVVKTPVGDTKKMVTWSKHDKRNAALTSGQRISLSAFASKYGGMDDSVDVCRDAGVHSVTIAVDSNNATRVRFYPDSGLPCSFFGQPSPPQCKPIGSVKDIRMSLIDRGCDEDKLSDKWISNHCRWIVWKLASTERRFSFSLSQSYLTYEHLITQLQQRFEKEIKGGCRSALRKVLNQDVAANSLMILCISQIVRQNKSKEYTETGKTRCDYILELTDGWYSIGGVLDSSLSALVSAGKIQVGSKLLTCNAKLEGPDDGVDPLDSSYLSSGRNYSAALCLIGNGTRLAKWDAKMGFVSSIHGSLLVRKISDIVPGGGNVPLIDLVVCRIYPRMFLERQGACSSNESPVISEAMEYKNRMNFDKKRLLAMERLSETVQNECIKVVDEMAPEVWQRLMASASPGDLYEQLSQSDQAIVEKWKEKRDYLLRDMVQKEIEARLEGDTALCRESTPFIRVFVKSYDTRESDAVSYAVNSCEGAMLTIWNPSEQQIGLLREGHVVRIRNLAVRASKHEGLLQITAGGKTQMDLATSSPIPLASIGYANRFFTNILRVHLTAKKCSAAMIPTSPAPEVDTVGIVLRASQEGSNPSEERETIYLTDETGMVLKIERDQLLDADDAFSSLSSSALQNIENPVTVAFRDLRVTHFDFTENCSVAVFAQTSSVAIQAANSRVSSLIRWAKSASGSAILRRAAACIDTGINTIRQQSSAATITAIGYIAGFDIPDLPGENNPSHLEIRVDCGMPELQAWDFPFFLLDEALRICSVTPEPVSLDQAHDEKYANLKVLGKIFSARGLLLSFSLRKKSSNMAKPCDDERYEVRQVRVADCSALAELLISCSR